MEDDAGRPAGEKPADDEALKAHLSCALRFVATPLTPLLASYRSTGLGSGRGLGYRAHLFAMVPVSISILGSQVNAVNGFFQIRNFTQYSTDIILIKITRISLESSQRNRFPDPYFVLYYN
jgi:hypothetical protein